MKFMVINGPNINMIGVREKGIYGSKSFTEICEYMKLLFFKAIVKEL